MPSVRLAIRGVRKMPAGRPQVADRENIIDVAVARAIEQEAEVLAMREQPDLDRLGSVAAVLRF